MAKIKTLWVITLFPDYFEAFQKMGVVTRAFDQTKDQYFELKIVNLRDFSLNHYKSVDDSSYGGGPGMVMRADVLENALLTGVMPSQNITESEFKQHFHVIFPSPRGAVWNHELCRDFAKSKLSGDFKKDLVFICGRYEGVDERFLEAYVDQEISLGDFVLTGGELAVLTIMDSSLRFVSGILGHKLGAEEESFEQGLLEHPQYTKPRVWKDIEVPAVLTEGHHQKIKEYQQSEALRITQKYRPDLLIKKSSQS